MHLAESGDVAAAIKAAAKSHPTIVVKRQTANSWHKKMREEALLKSNDDDSKKMLAAYDRHQSPDKERKGVLTSEADRVFLQSDREVVLPYDKFCGSYSRL